MWKVTHQTNPVSAAVNSQVVTTYKQLLEKSDIGFFDLELLKKGAQASQALAKQLSSKYNQVAILGIGGSSLGTQALVEALSPESLENDEIVFFDNVDSKSFFRKLDKTSDKTLWVLISKSGSTIETLSQAEYIAEYLKENNRPALSSNAVVITELRSSALYDWAQKNKVTCLEVPLTVGGRFSVLTPVGLFPIAFLGLPVTEIVAGAAQALKDSENFETLTGQFLESFERGEGTTYFFHYCDDLKYWGQWVQQLWAESLGKKETLGGAPAPALSVPMACRGSTDQHSVLQQIAEGNQKKFVCFLRVNEVEGFGPSLGTSLFSASSPLLGKRLGQLLAAEARATQEALNEAGVSSMTLTTDMLSPVNLGELMFTFELVVATLGLAYNINPFDQPGVERGKVITRTLLST